MKFLPWSGKRHANALRLLKLTLTFLTKIIMSDGAPPHTARATINFLKQLFPGCLTSKDIDFEWPSRSSDLTGPDFFLWNYLKSKVYVNKPKILDEPYTNIRQEIAYFIMKHIAFELDRPYIFQSRCVKVGALI